MMINNLNKISCAINSWNSCEEESNNRTRSNIVLKDKRAKSEYRGGNIQRKEYITLLVDDCIIRSQTERKCDYLLLDKDNKTARLIELKGLDYSHGVVQIINTMKLLGAQLKGMGYIEFLGRIAATRSPHIKDADYKKLKDAVYKECRIILEIRGNNRFEEKLT
jgi:hypothetical protein